MSPRILIQRRPPVIQSALSLSASDSLTLAEARAIAATLTGSRETATLAEASSVSAPGTITEFYNAASWSGGGSGDSDILWEDDFSTPCALGSPGSSCELNFDDATSTYGSPTATLALPHTRGSGGTVFNANPYPMLVRAIANRGTSYAASHGDSGGGDQDWMWDHNLKRGTSTVLCYFELDFDSNYGFGAEKIWDLNPPNFLGHGGIYWGNLHINLGAGTQQTTGTLWWQGTTGPSYNTGFTFQRGHKYAIQLVGKLASPLGASNGILRVLADDLGTSGNSIASGTSMTMRLNRTDYPWDNVGGYTQFGSIWVEAWANPGSNHTRAITNIRVRENNGDSSMATYMTIR